MGFLACPIQAKCQSILITRMQLLYEWIKAFEDTASIEVLTVTSIKMHVFWDLHHRVWLILADVSEELTASHPDGGGSKFLWNIGHYLPATWCTIPEDSHLWFVDMFSRFCFCNWLATFSFFSLVYEEWTYTRVDWQPVWTHRSSSGCGSWDDPDHAHNRKMRGGHGSMWHGS
jgi:hypothetical protein